MACLFCSRYTNDGIPISGDSAVAENARNITLKHFWFDITEINSTDSYACFDCWSKVEKFHEFYVMVENIHTKCSIKEEVSEVVMEEVKPVNPLSTWEDTLFANEDSFNHIENYSSNSDTEAINAQTLTFLNESIKHEDDHKEQINSVAPKQVTRSSKATIAKQYSDLSSSSKPYGSSCNRKKNRKSCKSNKGQQQKLSKVKLDKPSSGSIRKTKMDTILCYLCQKTFKYFSSLKNHFHKIHVGVESRTFKSMPFKPNASASKSKKNTKSDQKQQEKLDKPSSGSINKTKMDKIICYMCQRTFKYFTSLKIHFHKIHDPMESRTFECDICNKKFSQLNILKRHLDYHKWNILNFERDKSRTNCPICKKQLKFASLKAHIYVVHQKKKRKGVNKHICDVCGKGWRCQSMLDIHSLMHLDREQSQVQCDICGKWSKNINTLRAHKRMHERSPKKCPHCDKVKFTVRALNAHITLVHSAGTHQCTYCDKSFSRLQRLREHVATHTGESLYTCNYCSRTFKSASNKIKHMKTQHSEQYNADRAKRNQK